MVGGAKKVKELRQLRSIDDGLSTMEVEIEAWRTDL